MDLKWRVAAILFLAAFASGEFRDSIQEYEENCLGENRFHCADGGCIRQEQYCDDVEDCRDGSDEQMCTVLKIDASTCNKTHSYRCTDGSRCIPFERVCNRIGDCDDNSDEAGCSNVGNDTNEAFIKNITTANCTGFPCSDGTCISLLWVCDGTADCKDRGDEDNATLCREIKGRNNITLSDIRYCDALDIFLGVTYKCLDNSFCLQRYQMCDGMKDCKDGSDEGHFCSGWKTQCQTDTYCKALNIGCRPDRSGPECYCRNETYFAKPVGRCIDVDMCAKAEPVCSQYCTSAENRYVCSCEEGYLSDRLNTLCFAPEPDPLLFFSTHDSIGYVNVRSRKVTVLLDKLKEPHGVAYDGNYVYWVQTAEGHQAILRAKLDNMHQREIIVALGLEDPGDIAIDWLGGHIYFTDAERGHIAVCLLDGSLCTILKTAAKHPRYITLHPQNGDMYWADWHDKPVIMHAKMDGSSPRVFFNHLKNFPSGLTLDIPSGRMYFCDGGIQVVKLDSGNRYVFFDDPYHHPYAVSVFENTVYFSEFSSNSIQVVHKVDTELQRQIVAKFDKPVFGVHMYHPLLMRRKPHGCESDHCADLCLVTGNLTHSCACAEERKAITPEFCTPISFIHAPQFLIVGGGNQFTRIKYNVLGNPESRAVKLNVGRIEAMAYNNNAGILYFFDGLRKILYSISMSDFTNNGLIVVDNREFELVTDLGYDYVTNSLYYTDALLNVVGVLNLNTNTHSQLYKFTNYVVPFNLAVVPKYGKMFVAVKERYEHRPNIWITSFGMDGKNMTKILAQGFHGARVNLRYSYELDKLMISDESKGTIEAIHPDGRGLELFKSLSTSISSMTVSETTVFWTDRRTPRVFWAELHETGQNIRRIELSMFPNKTQLYVLSTQSPPSISDPLFHHICHRQRPCSHTCLQSLHPPVEGIDKEDLDSMGYTCFCPRGKVLINGTCEKLAICGNSQVHCLKINKCLPGVVCDGKKDCPDGEDEELCSFDIPPKCGPFTKSCHGNCVAIRTDCKEKETECSPEEFQCRSDKSTCIQRWQVCDAQNDCRDGSDEDEATCRVNTCLDTEMMCASGSCVLNSWRCDGDEDCPDGSDEADCEEQVCTAGFYRCTSKECIELSKRCDGQQDCLDYSDEDHCEDEAFFSVEIDGNYCLDKEYMCESNKSICLPITARCNKIVECPGGTDEVDCGYDCSDDDFKCAQEMFCVPDFMVCDGIDHCRDKSDESEWACQAKKRASKFSTPKPRVYQNCTYGYTCGNTRQCIEWSRVCDKFEDCYNGSDEEGNCSTACYKHNCSDICKATPAGPICMCYEGYKLNHKTNLCVDINECDLGACSQKCHNYPGSFICSCYHGYALRSDRRTCKALTGNMSLLYVSSNGVKWIAGDGHGGLEFESLKVVNITDIDYDVRRTTLYLTSTTGAQLVQSTQSELNILTNIGMPSKVAVDWVTGNVFFVDVTPNNKMLRVCNFAQKRCAKLQKLPPDAEVPALAVDPANRRIFYCITHQQDSVIWFSSFSGRDARDLTTVHNCTGLTVDSFKKMIYIAEGNPAHIAALDYDGGSVETVIASDFHVEDPRHVALFEDHIYILSTSAFKITRCSLYTKHCHPYIYRVFDANTFVIRHESVQRDDIINDCAETDCNGVCVLDDRGSACVCSDGIKNFQNICAQASESEAPVFLSYSTAKSTHKTSNVLILVFTALVALVVTLCIVYFVIRKRPAQLRMDAVVRYFGGGDSANEPAVEIPVGEERERPLLNPFQYVRRAWNTRQYTRNTSVASSSTNNDPAAEQFLTPPPSEGQGGSSNGDPSDVEPEIESKDTKTLFSL